MHAIAPAKQVFQKRKLGATKSANWDVQKRNLALEALYLSLYPRLIQSVKELSLNGENLFYSLTLVQPQASFYSSPPQIKRKIISLFLFSVENNKYK